jgi:hypothetical protein
MNKVDTIIFSKNRAMQLSCCLDSFYKQCEDIEKANISVLYTTSNQEHENSYKELKNKYKDINFVKENNFKDDLNNLLLNCKYVMFVVDDNIFINKFRLDRVLYLLNHFENCIGFSLRLGHNTQYCYPLNKNQKLKDDYFDVGSDCIFYKWQSQDADYGYIMEVSSSLYNYKDIQYFIKYGSYNNPNQLESVMANNTHQLVDKKYLLCFRQSVAFCNPINRIQNVDLANRCGNKPEYSIDSLLEKFNQGYRININKFDGFVSNGCHQEVDLEFIKENK